MSITSSLDSMRGGRSAISLIETRQPTIPCVSSAPGAAASHSFIDPHSSASKCPKASQRNRFTGMIWATAPDTKWKHFALTAVKEKRFIAGDEEMIVGESSGRCSLRCENREAVYSRSYLVDPCFH